MNQAVVKFKGSKGGTSSPHQPYIAPANLRSISYCKILLALGEGEFYGDLTGEQIFLDGTPLIDSSGNQNFPQVKWEFRNGSVDQPYIKGVPSIENEIAIGVELRSDTPYIRAISNPQLSAVRVRLKWPALQQQKSNGDIVGYRIDYVIYIATDGGSYQPAITTAVEGRSVNGYERSHRIDLPSGSSWSLKIVRVTANASDVMIADTMQVMAITEIIDRKLRYPNTALLYIEFDSSQFQNIPVVSCMPFGRQVKIPTNYDSIAKTYSGVWDGTFKIGWTDNPAWISYDLSTNPRFGTGRRIIEAQVDKWTLYEIGQYCDELVSDGNGGMEPRYTCNIYIQKAEQAWTVLRDIAAIYNGMSYWAQGQLVNVGDMPRDIDYVYTKANVLNGKFSYAGSSTTVKYTRAIISYDNPNNKYESDVTMTFDKTLQRRFGDIPINLAALGCTSESEAQRRGQWAIHTNANDRAVSFSVGLDGLIPLPGFIIGIADNKLAGRSIGGRISDASGLSITLDRDTEVKTGDTLYINLPSGIAQGRTVSVVSGRIVTITTAYSETPQAEMQYSIDADDLAIQTFKVTSIIRKDNTSFTISAVKYNVDKFGAIDNGARIQERPISVIPVGAQVPPTGVAITQSISVEQTMALTTMSISWVPAVGAVAYDVEWQKDSGEFIKIPRTGSLSVDIKGVYTGNYLARVRGVSSFGAISVPASSILTSIVGKTGSPATVAALSPHSIVFGIELVWLFPTNSDDLLKTQIEINTTASEPGSTTIDFGYPTNKYTLMGLAAGATLFFRARLVDRSGNLSPWSSWVSGSASASASEILGYLEGQISETQLASGLLTKVENGDAAYSEATATTGDLAAMYTIKTQLTAGGRTYLAGIGVGVENTSGIIESQVLIAADRFAIITSDSALHVPFAVTGGQTFINSAFIQDASIVTAKIADLNVTNGKIANLAVDNAKIANLAVTTGKIADLTVSTLKIGYNSVTVPVAAYTASAISIPNNNTAILLQSVTLTNPDAINSIPVAILSNALAGVFSIGLTFQLRKNGVALSVIGGPVIMWLDSLAAGATATYGLYATQSSSGSSSSVVGVFLQAMAVAR